MEPDGEPRKDEQSGPQYVVARPEGAAIVISLTERSIFGTAKIEALHSEISQAVRSGPASYSVLDLNKVEFISSGFLGMLLKLNQKLRSSGVPLRLCNLHPALAEVIRAGKMDKLFDVRVNLEDALNPI